jgi:hypothetical protein
MLNEYKKITFGFFKTKSGNMLGGLFHKFSGPMDLSLDSGWGKLKTKSSSLFGKVVPFRAISPMTGCTTTLGDQETRKHCEAWAVSGTY